MSEYDIDEEEYQTETPILNEEGAEESAKKDAEIARLKEQLRNQAKKSKEEKKPEVVEAPIEAPEIDEDELAEKVVEKLQSRQADQYKETAFDWMAEQSWGGDYSSEGDPEGKKIAKLNEALKVINKIHPVNKPEDYQHNLQRAHLASIDSFEQVSKEQLDQMSNIATQREYASGASNSSVKHGDTTQKYSPEAMDLFEKMGVADKILKKD